MIRQVFYHCAVSCPSIYLIFLPFSLPLLVLAAAAGHKASILG
jgi:hypothetical protein